MRTRFVRLKPVAAFTKESITDGASQHWAPTAHAVSDGLHAFSQISQIGATHERYVTGGGGQATKTPSCVGSTPCWATTRPHCDALATPLTMPGMAPAAWPSLPTSFNQRFDLPAIVPRLLRAAVQTQPLPRRILRLPEAGG